jgi:hypothetical protein
MCVEYARERKLGWLESIAMMPGCTEYGYRDGFTAS